MTIFAITYVHPDEQRWNQFLTPHLEWIQKHLDDKTIVASGPLPDQPELSALIIMDARDRAHVDQLLAEDPFVTEGLVTELTVLRWEPIFGALANRISGADATPEA
jgi:uncharacterized protein YciI